jgi:hypothetical protein
MGRRAGESGLTARCGAIERNRICAAAFSNGNQTRRRSHRLPGIALMAPVDARTADSGLLRAKRPGTKIVVCQLVALVAPLLPPVDASGAFAGCIGICHAGASEDIAWYSRAVNPFGWPCLKDASAEALVNVG